MRLINFDESFFCMSRAEQNSVLLFARFLPQSRYNSQLKKSKSRLSVQKFYFDFFHYVYRARSDVYKKRASVRVSSKTWVWHISSFLIKTRWCPRFIALGKAVSTQLCCNIIQRQDRIAAHGGIEQ